MLSGVVTDSTSSQPVAGVEIRLLVEASFIRAQTQTAEDGSYSFSIRPGTYSLNALVGEQRSGLSRQKVLVDEFELLSDSRRNLVVPLVFGVTGRATDADGRLDIVTASRGSTLIADPSRVAAFVNDGTGVLADRADFFPDDLVLQGTDVEPADFDGDDRVDFYTSGWRVSDRLAMGKRSGTPASLSDLASTGLGADDGRAPLVDALVDYNNPSSVRIGQGAGFQSWPSVMEESSLLAVDPDSVWMWDVAPNTNLSTGIPQRFGGVHAVNEDGFFSLAIDRQAIHDGLEATAFDPDEFFGLERTNPIIIDLGAVFRVNRVRFFPRLDSINKARFLQEFRMFTSSAGLDGPYANLLSFLTATPNVEPVVDRTFRSRDARYLMIEPLVNREWEIAEFEVYGDGTLPIGEFISRPLRTTVNTPVWGRAVFDGGDLALADVVVQTRTGTDPDPVLFFLLRGYELEQISRLDYATALPGLQGPIVPNPEWSQWQTVSDGIIHSPGLRPYIQFRLAFSVPGSRMRRLAFEYSFPPVVSSLVAEIAPEIAMPGVETEFTVSMVARLTMVTTRHRPRDSGFRLIQINTAAAIDEVVRVLVDDEEVNATVTSRPGGVDVTLWRRVVQTGTYIQIVFRAKVFQDRTRFEVRAVDRRLKEGLDEEAAQFAEAGDADETTLEQSLVVVLASDGNGLPLVVDVEPRNGAVFTPNGDGINDIFVLEFTLLKLTAPAPVVLEIYGLDGRLRRRSFETASAAGVFAATWDGRQDTGVMAPPGTYLYELRVESDQAAERVHGFVGVAY